MCIRDSGLPGEYRGILKDIEEIISYKTHAPPTEVIFTVDFDELIDTEAKKCLIRAMKEVDVDRAKPVFVYKTARAEDMGVVYVAPGLSVIYGLGLVDKKAKGEAGETEIEGKILGGRGSYRGRFRIKADILGEDGIEMYAEDAYALFGNNVGIGRLNKYTLMRVPEKEK